MIWLGLIFTFNTSFRYCHICLIFYMSTALWLTSWFSLHTPQLLIYFNFHRFKLVPHGSILKNKSFLSGIKSIFFVIWIIVYVWEDKFPVGFGSSDMVLFCAHIIQFFAVWLHGMSVSISIMGVGILFGFCFSFVFIAFFITSISQR